MFQWEQLSHFGTTDGPCGLCTTAVNKPKYAMVLSCPCLFLAESTNKAKRAIPLLATAQFGVRNETAVQSTA